jgi:hypothetical protein
MTRKENIVSRMCVMRKMESIMYFICTFLQRVTIENY